VFVRLEAIVGTAVIVLRASPPVAEVANTGKIASGTAEAARQSRKTS